MDEEESPAQHEPVSPPEQGVNDLELLRLRVLASRKRKNKEESREEGEVSDSEGTLHKTPPALFGGIPARSISLPHHQRSAAAPRPVRKKRGRKQSPPLHDDDINTGVSDRFFELLEREMLPFSDSFSPQSCVVLLDESEADGDATNDEHIRIQDPPLMSASEKVSSPELNVVGVVPGEGVKAPDNSKIKELRLREISKQKELLSTTRVQSNLIKDELKTLSEQLEETERVTRIAVEKQQKLKAQLRETKALIHRSKQLKTQNLARQHSIKMEQAQKAKLIALLEGSIASKLASHSAPSADLAMNQFPQSEAIGKDLEIITDASSSSDAEVTMEAAGSSGKLASVAALTSQRSVEIVILKKKALRIQRDLIAAQISLLKSSQVQKTKTAKREKKTTKRIRTPKALGKVMGMTPLIGKAKAADLATSEPNAVNTDNEQAYLEFNRYFPACLYNIGGYLLEGSTLVDIVNDTSALILDNMSNRNDEHDRHETTTPSLEVANVKDIYIYESSRNPDDDDDKDSFGFHPYISPLRVFKSYRFSPYFSLSAQSQGLLSTSFSNRISPHKIFCSTELEGERCARRHCQGQHFRSALFDDSEMLEDFMLTLLSMPIPAGGPFRDHLEVATEVKQRLLRLSGQNLPLISLVSVLLDTFKKMNTDAVHIVSFTPSKNELSEVASSILHKRQTSSEVVNGNHISLDTRRSLISGVAALKDVRNNQVSRYRYFPPSSSSADPLSVPADEIQCFESFVKSVASSTGMSLQQAASTLKDGIENFPDSTLLTSLLADLDDTDDVNNNNIKDKSCLGWIRWLQNYRNDIDSLRTSLAKALEPTTCLECSSTAVDFVYGVTKVMCDAGKSAEALSLLCDCSHPKEEESSFVQTVCSMDFSPVDHAYLLSLYFYLQETNGAYPHRSFLLFPFDVVRRLDFYFLIPWRTDEESSSDHENAARLLEDLLISLRSYPDASCQLREWVFANYCSLLEIYPRKGLGIDVNLLGAPSSSICLMETQFAGHEPTLSERVLSTQLQGHPLGVLRLVLSLRTLPTDSDDKTQGKDEIKELLAKDILRNFWSEYFDLTAIIEDESLIASIASHLGCSDLFPMVHQVAAARKYLKSDPFFWFLSILTVVLLGQPVIIGLDVINSLLEIAIAHLGDALPSTLLLCLLTKLSDEAPEGDAVSVPLRSRFITIASNDDKRPESNVEFQWSKNPWYAQLTLPFDEFAELNIQPVPYNAMINCGIFDLKSLLASSPFDIILWRLLSRKSTDQECIRKAFASATGLTGQL